MLVALERPWALLTWVGKEMARNWVKVEQAVPMYRRRRQVK
jgi:hypothetical protein